jgi:hypothetical protein
MNPNLDAELEWLRKFLADYQKIVESRLKKRPPQPPTSIIPSFIMGLFLLFIPSCTATALITQGKIDSRLFWLIVFAIASILSFFISYSDYTKQIREYNEWTPEKAIEAFESGKEPIQYFIIESLNTFDDLDRQMKAADSVKELQKLYNLYVILHDKLRMLYPDVINDSIRRREVETLLRCIESRLLTIREIVINNT